MTHTSMVDALKDAAHKARDEGVSYLIYKSLNDSWGGDSTWHVRRFGDDIPRETQRIHRVYPKHKRERQKGEF